MDYKAKAKNVANGANLDAYITVENDQGQDVTESVAKEYGYKTKDGKIYGANNVKLLDTVREALKEGKPLKEVKEKPKAVEVQAEVNLNEQVNEENLQKAKELLDKAPVKSKPKAKRGRKKKGE